MDDYCFGRRYDKKGSFLSFFTLPLFRKFVPRSSSNVNICNPAYKLAELDLCKDSVVKEY